MRPSSITCGHQPCSWSKQSCSMPVPSAFTRKTFATGAEPLTHGTATIGAVEVKMILPSGT